VDIITITSTMLVLDVLMAILHSYGKGKIRPITESKPLTDYDKNFAYRLRRQDKHGNQNL